MSLINRCGETRRIDDPATNLQLLESNVMIGAVVIGSFATFVEAGLMADQFGLLHTDRLYNSFDDRRGRNGKHHPKALPWNLKHTLNPI